MAQQSNGMGAHEIPQPKNTNPLNTEDGKSSQHSEPAQQTPDSTNKSLAGLLHEDREMDEDMEQREEQEQWVQLDKATDQLEEKSSNKKRKSQLNRLLGGVKNFFSGKKKRTRSLRASKSFQEDNNNTDKGTSSLEDSQQAEGLSEDPNSSYHPENSSQAQIDDNLEVMCSNLTVFKMLAVDLGGEVESQNKLEDNMEVKMEDVDLQIQEQYQELSKLLKE
ncbi:soluble NSF attachment protein 29 isoform X2 [Drosophila biarmipes]|uniref:soluble NSF attachment protein 29 isoform X2 n=1 Tax=Drosophila biarmipes TaxID=125945 RepID=UPI0007E6E449|nr:soluble NSF attachment protein 29 isoform X2 [Drosophila biarmipes]